MFGLKRLLSERIDQARVHALEHVFNTTHKELRQRFLIATPGLSGAKPPMFPSTQYLEDIDIEALVTMFQIEREQIPVASKVIEGCGFVLLSPGIYVGNSSAHDMRKVQLAMVNGFGGVVVSVLSNDMDVLWKLHDASLNPPPPWIAFPDMDPDSLGALQGDVEYWWAAFWNPFWGTLDSAEQVKFLHDRNATVEWSDCIFAHRSVVQGS